MEVSLFDLALLMTDVILMRLKRNINKNSFSVSRLRIQTLLILGNLTQFFGANKATNCESHWQMLAGKSFCCDAEDFANHLDQVKIFPRQIFIFFVFGIATFALVKFNDHRYTNIEPLNVSNQMDRFVNEISDDIKHALTLTPLQSFSH